MDQRAPIVQGEKVWLRGLSEQDLDAYESFVSSRDALVRGGDPLLRDAPRNPC